MTNLKDQPTTEMLPTTIPPLLSFHPGYKRSRTRALKLNLKFPFGLSDSSLRLFQPFSSSAAPELKARGVEERGLFASREVRRGGVSLLQRGVGGVHLDASNRAVCEEGASPEVVEDKSQLASHCYPVALEKLQPWERERFKQKL